MDTLFQKYAGSLKTLRKLFLLSFFFQAGSSAFKNVLFKSSLPKIIIISFRVNSKNDPKSFLCIKNSDGSTTINNF